MELQYTLNGETFTVPLSGTALTIGRKPSCDVQVDHQSISSVHVRVQIKGQEVELSDLGSSNGTLVGGNRHQHVTLRCGDRFRLGVIDFIITGKGGGQAEAGELPRMYLLANLQGEEKRFPLAKAELTAGRKDDCDIAIDDASISGHHAKLVLTSDGLQINDLNSSNGTYLNGEKVAEGVARHGDRLRLGKIEFRVYSGGGRTSSRLRSGRSTAPRSTMPLYLLMPEDGGPHLALSVGPATVGRKDPATVILDDPSISSQHLRIEVSTSGIRFTDLDSANGTYLNDERVFRGVIQPGDKLRLGRLRFSVCKADAAAVKITGAPNKKPSPMAMVAIAGIAAAIVFIIGGAFLFLPALTKKKNANSPASKPSNAETQKKDAEAEKLQEILAQKVAAEKARAAAEAEAQAKAARQQQAAAHTTTHATPAAVAKPVATMPQPEVKVSQPVATPAKPAPEAQPPKSAPVTQPETNPANPTEAPKPAPAPAKAAADPAAALKKTAAQQLQSAAPVMTSLAAEMNPVAAAEQSATATSTLEKAVENLRKALQTNPNDAEAKQKLAEAEARLFWCKRVQQ